MITRKDVTKWVTLIGYQ